MTNPFASPTIAPAMIPAKTATTGSNPAFTVSAVTTLDKAIVEPTERSMPPLMIMIVMPIALTATITVCESTTLILKGERYFSGLPVKMEKANMTSASPRNGPRRVIHVRIMPEIVFADVDIWVSIDGTV